MSWRELLGVGVLLALFVGCLVAFWLDEDDEESEEKAREDDYAP